MTRLFTDGAEMGDKLFWTSANSGAYLSSTYKRSGVYSYGIYGNPSFTKEFTPISELYLRVCYLLNQNNLGGGTFLNINKDATNIISIIGNYSGNTKFQYYITGIGAIAQGIIIPPGYLWHLIEIYYKMNDSTGRFVSYIDGIKDADYTGDTKPGSDTTVNTISFHELAGGNTEFIDDLALNDTNGTEDNSWCGDGRIIKITPSGSGIDNNWLNSGSVSGSANYLYVDEYPKDDDTTFIYASGSNAGLQTQFAMSNQTFTGNTILRIYPEARVRKTTGTPETVKLGFIVPGGTDTMSGSLAITSIDSYSYVAGSGIRKNPVTSASWTENDINSLEFIAEIGPTG